ncbi:3-isopropylmalate dehydratase large subunit [Candidatus Microgenomates bacterium]|nr:MAG: 3-isopropylmalate dehydratase large subunit [Candidatus Microgenomates bacterium]
MGQTIAEKIFSLHSGKKVAAGDFVVANLDLVMAHDTTCAWAIDPFYKIAKKVWDKDKIFIPFDHAFPAPNTQMATLQKKIRQFASEQGIPITIDGVCHQIMSERFINPGGLVLGADSHTPTGGGVGALTIGVGSTDAAIAMATGTCWFRVPPTVKIVINGTLPKGVYAKDVILMVAKDIGPEGGNNRVFEYGGETVKHFNVPERLTLTNMSAEMGVKAAIVAPDKHTRDYLSENNRLVDFDENVLQSDDNATYAQVLEYDVSKLVPQVAKPHEINNVFPVATVAKEKTKVDQVFIGSCTNCRIEDLDIVHAIWKDQKLIPGIRAIITPASKRVYLQALHKGYIEFFTRMGAIILAPGCGPCLGRHGGVLADDEVCVSTSNRNFMGRMGSPKAFIYLASPATAAATALTGFITDPRRYLN